MKKIILFLIFGSILPVACSLQPAYETEQDWSHSADLQWTVRVKYWPGRFKNPEITGDTPVVANWNYRVENKEDYDGVYIFQSDGEDTYLLRADPAGEIRGIHRLVGRKGGNYKVEHLYSGDLKGGAFFYLPPQKHPPVLWYHPAVDVRADQKRFTFKRYSSRPDDWVDQECEKEGNILNYKLIYEPADMEVNFSWPQSKPWWKKAVWRRRGRVVAVARTTFASPE